jgi:hypothetical protein
MRQWRVLGLAMLDHLIARLLEDAPILSIAISTSGLVATIGIFAFQVAKNNRLRSADLLLKLETMYDAICAARMKEPSIIAGAKSIDVRKIDGASDQQMKALFYAEMVMGFIEASVYLRYVERAISPLQWDKFVLPMLMMEYRYCGPLLHYVAWRDDLSGETRTLLGYLNEQEKQKRSLAAAPHESVDGA